MNGVFVFIIKVANRLMSSDYGCVGSSANGGVIKCSLLQLSLQDNMSPHRPPPVVSVM